MQELIHALKSALFPFSLPRGDAVLLAGVSGGADSVALLLALHALRQDTPFSLCAVHVEHGLRGDASLADAAFVEDLCLRLEVPLFLYHAGLSGGMDAPGVEFRAREARRRFFAQAMAECKADALLLAHHRNDQAETVLMRLLRGAGAKGLGGMQSAAPFEEKLLMRPFLFLSGQRLKDSLIQAGQPWREDESNRHKSTLRNNLRLTVFPQLEEMQPQAAAHMAQTAQRLQWDEECLHDLAEILLKEALCDPLPWYALRASPLLAAPRAVALRALRLWAERCPNPAPKGSRQEQALSYADTLRLFDLLSREAQASANLPGELRVLRTQAHLHLLRQDGLPLRPAPAPEAQRLCPDLLEYSLGAWRFTLSPLAAGAPLPVEGTALPLTEHLLSLSPVLRLPLPEDRMHPFGAPGSKSLRRYFTDQKVPAPFRAAWPVLAREGNVLWVPGVGAAEQTRLPVPRPKGLWQLVAHGPF